MIMDKQGWTALHKAAIKGHAELCEVLITDAKCSIDIRDNWGSSPLHVAVVYGNAGVARALVEASANIEAKQK